MDSRRSHKAKAKGKEKMVEGSDRPKRDTKRGDNWRHPETAALIDAIDQVHDRRGRVGFSFSSVEYQEIYNLFMKRIPDSTRDRERIINRNKVVLKMFRLCDELAKRSGCGWDDTTHRPIAPSEKEYEEMVMAKGEKGRFLLNGNFPWYRKMERMVGGQSASGNRSKGVVHEPEPIHELLGSQMSIHGSETGSSDDPLESSGAGEKSDQQTQPSRRRAQTPSSDNCYRSDGSYPQSMNSGSKRKSTDTSQEPNVRGKRCRDKNRSRQVEGRLLSDAGFEIAESMRADTTALLAVSEEMDKCCAKLKELCFQPDEYDYTLNLLNEDVKRKWFLMNDRETIQGFVRRSLDLKNVESNPRPPPYPYNTAYQGFPYPHPAANTASGQFYPPPNPGASNFFFPPNEQNRDGNFM